MIRLWAKVSNRTDWRCPFLIANIKLSSFSFFFSGLLLVLLGSLATAAQMIVEEVFLKKHGFHALHVVGMEGFFGMFVMGFVSCPLYTARWSSTDTSL
ncbi:unnamed protein product [Dibothriocephalus latus]|uniref:Uncharacterized protein n=1 Tax=Dibothriocephalus latus TaxID=60516 RepID=A0A3P7NI16_DIBLA|nr:unnamed protein product [Dibothriocephalus latus]